MRLGVENRKKVIFTAMLSVVAVVLFANMVFNNNGPAVASVSSTSVDRPSASPTAAESRRAAHKAAVRSRTGNDLDPSLRTADLRASEDVTYSGTGRNIFKAAPDAPVNLPEPVCAQPGGPSGGKARCTPFGPQPAPPPPPIDLKFFGFASKPGEPKKVFLIQGEDIFIAKEGDIVDRRYKVVQIKPTSVMIEDVLNNHTQELPLTQATT